MPRHATLAAALTAALLLLGSPRITRADPLYSIRDLTPPDYTSSTAYDINADGDVAGIAGRFVAGVAEEAFFFYDHSEGTSTVFGVGTVTPRGSIVGTGFREAAINDSGQIAGSAAFVGGSAETHGFIYSGIGTATFTDLGTFPPGTAIRPASDALDLNNSGVAAGTASSGADTTGVDYRDIYIGSASPITDIDGEFTALSGNDFGRAINGSGIVAGENQDSKAALFSGAAETVFLSSTSLASVSSVATDLNDSGVVTGHTIDNASFIYDTDAATLRILPNLAPDASRVLAKAINASGDTVGWGDRGAGLSNEARGFVHLYDENASYILEDHTQFTGSTVPGLGDWERLRTAWGINDEGWIVGVGDRRFDGETFPTPRAYLLIPIPEPSSLSLLITALLLMSAGCGRSARAPIGTRSPRRRGETGLRRR